MKNIKYGLLCLIPSVILLIFWDKLPENIGIHYNMQGYADSISNRWFLVIVVPLIGFVGHVVYMLVLERKPEWVGQKGFHKYSFLYAPLLTCFAIIFMLWNSR